MKRLPLASAISRAGLAMAMLAILGGCKTLNTYNSRHDTTFGAKRQVQNVYQTAPLPEHLRRVALLPMHRGHYNHVDMELIQESFVQELAKRNLFELVFVDDESMLTLFGSPSFSSVEVLPTKLISRLHSVYGIDGVMLIDVSYFNAYQPVGLGIRVKLLDGHTGEIIWAADEVFDSAEPAVSNAARKYFQRKSVNQFPLQKTQTVLHSPLRFSKYVAEAIFSTVQPAPVDKI